VWIHFVLASMNSKLMEIVIFKVRVLANLKLHQNKKAFNKDVAVIVIVVRLSAVMGCVQIIIITSIWIVAITALKMAQLL